MWRVFNMGVGFVLVAEPEAERMLVRLCESKGFDAARIGVVSASSGETRFAWAD
jgi:phosphoribosylaminoimidazole (AIR) synthetase